eukprot:6200983-Pleurochrysis_carterae.AAC.1
MRGGTWQAQLSEKFRIQGKQQSDSRQKGGKGGRRSAPVCSMLPPNEVSSCSCGGTCEGGLESGTFKCPREHAAGKENAV